MEGCGEIDPDVDDHVEVDQHCSIGSPPIGEQSLYPVYSLYVISYVPLGTLPEGLVRWIQQLIFGVKAKCLTRYRQEV